jgi:16S rRNA (cytosine1402-N4)-methyltransferase
MSDHQPVLMEEALRGLAIVGDGWYVDATYGRGGHSAGILAQLGAAGRLLAIDKDPQAVADAARRFADDPRFTIRHGGFEQFRNHVAPWLEGRGLAGVLFDLGVSSPQLDTPERGFSFAADGPLDMRMNTEAGPTLAQWLAAVKPAELARVIAQYGEQPGAHRIAAAIVRAREMGPVTTTGQLAAIVKAAAPASNRRQHPATRVFQALRIALNDELNALQTALSQALDLLAVGGRLVVISFHSLEDRIVKRYMNEQARGDPAYAGLPNIPLAAQPTLRLVGKLVRPSEREIEQNPRARSARLRIAEKTRNVNSSDKQPRAEGRI